MRASPRPVRRVHFFTETIASADGGNHSFYLDTTNENQNYWGSSIFSQHQDVRNPNGDLHRVHVPSMTLTDLLQQTVRVEAGAHVMIKMDVEGAEYELLNQAYDSGILCKLAGRAIRIDLLVEVHGEVSTELPGVT